MTAATMTPTELRLQLCLGGYSPLPINGKKPILDEWQKKTITNSEEISLWSDLYPYAQNTGILTRLTPVLDIDILVPDAAAAIETLVRKRFEDRGAILVRIGAAPKRAILFRTDDPFKKITKNVIAPNATEQKIELLANGQQVVCFGVHPDTQQAYAWFGGQPGEIRHEDLPYLSEAEANALVLESVQLLVSDFGFKEKTTSQTEGTGNGSDPNAWADLLGNIFEGCSLHDSLVALSAKLASSGMEGGAIVNLLRGAMQSTSAPHDARWQERYDDIRRLVTSAANKFRGAKSGNGAGRLIQSSAEFVAGFTPPDYLVEGLIQRRFVYAMTAPPGDGKTCVALRIAAHAATGLSLGGREVEKIRVLFFAGENPDDVRMRWIKLCEEMKQDPADLEVSFLPGAPPIAEDQIRKRINAEVAERGPLGLLIVDTSAAYFRGDDENSNAQLGAHARMLRSFVGLPGGPSVIVTTHPTKHPDMDNLVPRGGGAFLAEVDGNLVCLRNGDIVELHWHGKLRGPDFTPIPFKITPGTTSRLTDSRGRPIWTVTARPITEDEQTAAENTARGRQNELMATMQGNPDASLRVLAAAVGWKTRKSETNVSLVRRTLAALKKEGLVEKRQDRWTLTKAGQRAAKAGAAEGKAAQAEMPLYARDGEAEVPF
jgi:hypothetical protein